MLEKLKGFIDLKAFLMVIGIVCTGYSAYLKVGDHETKIVSHTYTIQTLEKNEIRVDERLRTLEKKQERTDGQLEKLNQTLNELNINIVKLASTLENLSKNKGS